MKNIDKHIILIGFMGSGKSSVGRELAKRLNVKHFDTDEEIEKSEQLSVKEIFETKGEQYFRQLEKKIFELTIKASLPAVISTGGGLVLSKNNRELMKDSYVIFLDTSANEIYNRLKDNKDRPLLNNGKELTTTITDILGERQKIYQQIADLTVGTDGKQIEQIVDQILSKL
ncbi:hypothetical protein BHF71_08270 [Vulcanibacillus modesticaldus]|uniref:Shikimate kinase n=1 Tax=Vulcanibacillus modesticaldus TaxID=337097 RepID=A0A1D2YV73_9BACI|nr:shikimate kinase [Vulcanibacillus modesticaldus]OEF99608.1 hypothetical protein BHF71_08270 [Vulcanibacillus modesticaldus]